MVRKRSQPESTPIRKRPKQTTPGVPTREPESDPAAHWLPIVGIGASAGGLDALNRILKRLPAEPGLPLVVVQHLSPHHKSLLGEILQEATRMPVTQVNADVRLARNHVYVIPPDRFLECDDGMLRLRPHPGIGSPHSIDSFFRSLAKVVGARAVGVVVSGTGSDGANGLREIHAAGGITITQSPDSAEHDGMPRAAIATNVVDLVLDPEEIADELVEIAKHPPQYAGPMPDVEPASSLFDDKLTRVFAVLRRVAGVDFSQYKKATVYRRVQRRMLLQKLSDLGDYLDLLARDAGEVRDLQKDLLIQVTSFFREPASFDLLTSQVFPEILKRKSDGPIRIWVPGCATGEEAYSLAIALLETVGADAPETPVQIFGTDLSETAVEQARAGSYPENIAADLTSDRLRRFFTRSNATYSVAQRIREMCVFAKQDVTRDPPFSRLDLVVCRNLLIYLEPALQKKLMSIFHYALKPGAFLLLGQAETVGASADLFSIADKRQKLYRKKSVQTPVGLDFSTVAAMTVPTGERRTPAPTAFAESQLLREARQVILNRYGPPGVIIDAELAIVETIGQTGPYLELAPGSASFNVLKMARHGLTHALRMAVHSARRDNRPVRREGIRIVHDGSRRLVNLSVAPLSDGRAMPYLLVLFEDVTPPGESVHADATESRRKGRANDAKLRVMEQELDANRVHMQSMIQDLEAANEELQSANEEILSSNEELQSTNEELNTAREELQSTNEEINTVNEELHGRNDELIRVNSDLTNLLASVQAATVIVGNDLSIRRFTPMAERTLNLIPTDVGRPIHHIKPNIELPRLEEKIRSVVDGVTPYNAEVRDAEGRWMLLGIRPYKDVENRIDGAVITLTDIDERKRTEAGLHLEQQLSQSICDAITDWVLLLDDQRRILKANVSFREAFRIGADDVLGLPLQEIDEGWNDPRIRGLLERALKRVPREDNVDVDANFPILGRRRIMLRARRIDRLPEPPYILLVARYTNGGEA